MNDQQIKQFVYFIFDRYAAGYEPTTAQIEHALLDFRKQQVPKRDTMVDNLDQRAKPINIVVKGVEGSE